MTAMRTASLSRAMDRRAQAERTGSSLLIAEMQDKLAASESLVAMLRGHLASSEDQVTRLQRRLKMAMGSHDQLSPQPPLSGGSSAPLSASPSTSELAQSDIGEEVVLRRPPRLDQIPADRRTSFYSKPRCAPNCPPPIPFARSFRVWIRWTEIVRKNRFLYIKVSEIKDLPKTKVGLCFLSLTG